MKYAYRFSKITEISSQEKLKLLQLFGTEEEIFQIPEYQIAKQHMIPQRTKEVLLLARKEQDWEREYEKFRSMGIQLFVYGRKEYPKKLMHIYDPPYSLYVKGELPKEEQRCVAIVGARKCSGYGHAVAKMIAKRLAEAGIGIVSGLAYGIDAAAHMGAVEAKTDAKTAYGVLGCGVDVCYPASHRRLYGQVEHRGGLISEFLPGQGPRKWQFPMRNRIISGLSESVIVVEAKSSSGSLITADLALEQGRNVYAVPGRMGDSLSDGTNWLLAQGAGVFCSVEGFLKEQGILESGKREEEKIMEIPLEKNERLVYSVLDSTPKHPEAVMEKTGLAVPEAAAALSGLKDKGCVHEIYKNYYIKVM